MNINLLKRTAAGASLVLAAAGLVLTLSTSASAAPISSGTGSTVGTIPLCDWTLKGVEGSIALTNADYVALPSNATKYQGLTYPLVGQSTPVEIYVSDPTLPTRQTDTSNCSWYGVAKGGSVSVTTTADPKFTSRRTGDASDTSMGFLLDDSNKLVGLATIETCEGWTKVTAADVFDSTTSSTPIALGKGVTTTTSNCTYSVAYSTTIPAGKRPTVPGVDYELVGPVMTTTLVITS